MNIVRETQEQVDDKILTITEFDNSEILITEEQA
jgi:hypothetical protein